MIYFFIVTISGERAHVVHFQNRFIATVAKSRL